MQQGGNNHNAPPCILIFTGKGPRLPLAMPLNLLYFHIHHSSVFSMPPPQGVFYNFESHVQNTCQYSTTNVKGDKQGLGLEEVQWCKKVG